MSSLSDITLGDLVKGFKRYRPFILVVAAIALIAVVLPGKPGPSSSNVAAGGGGYGTSAAGGKAGAKGGKLGAAGSGDAGSIGADTGSGGSAGGGRVGSSSGTGAAGGTGPAAGPGGTAGPGAGPAAGFDANCDPATGRVRMPSVYAPPCVRAWSGNNGGATYQGVTGDTITIVHYAAQVDAATRAVLTAAGDNDSADQINQTFEDYTALFQHHFQLYGRHVKLIHMQGTGPATDDSAGKADAVKIAKQYHAFMSMGSVNDAFVNELVADGVMCVCTTTLPSSFYIARAPYVWGNGLPDENQAYLMRAEMIGKQIAGQKAKFAGDATLKLKERSFGLIWYNTGGSYLPGERFFVQQLAKYGVHLKDSASYVFDTNQAQQQSDTIVSKFKSEGITSIIFVGDPIYPVFYTQAATKQNYHPEWIVTGSALTDTTFFARVYDKSQWNHAFGMALLAARGPKNESESYRVYNWRYHKDPPAPNTYSVIYPSVLMAFIGMQGAGPNLNPQTFKAGMFTYPPSPAKRGPTNSLVSFGRSVWSWDDYNLSDDSTLIWWDNTASGPDELGHSGVGMYRFIDMGKRYLPGEIPRRTFKAFETANTVTVFPHTPPSDTPPDYGPEKDAYK